MRIIYSICALVLVLALASKDYRPCCEACEYCSKVNNQKINLKHRHYDNLFVEHGVIPRPIDSIEKALDALETSLFLTFTPEESIALYNLHLSTKTGFGPSALKVHFATLGDQVVEYAEAVYNIFTSYYEVRNPLFSINAFFQLDVVFAVFGNTVADKPIRQQANNGNGTEQHQKTDPKNFIPVRKHGVAITDGFSLTPGSGFRLQFQHVITGRLCANEQIAIGPGTPFTGKLQHAITKLDTTFQAYHRKPEFEIMAGRNFDVSKL